MISLTLISQTNLHFPLEVQEIGIPLKLIIHVQLCNTVVLTPTSKKNSAVQAL